MKNNFLISKIAWNYKMNKMIQKVKIDLIKMAHLHFIPAILAIIILIKVANP